MPNPYKNKIVYNGTTLIDLTGDDVTAADVAAGKYFHLPTGERTVGTATAGSVIITDTQDVHGGTIREITSASVVNLMSSKSITANGTYSASSDSVDGYSSVVVNVSGGSVTQDENGYIVLPSTGGGGGGGATAHEIHLEFSDTTDTDIDVYYDDSVLGTMITAYKPSTWTYSNKTVVSAALDNTTWYSVPQGTWTTMLSLSNVQWNASSDPYPYCWITSLSSVYPAAGEIWRVTWAGIEYICTAQSVPGYSYVCIGNPKYVERADDGTDVPFCFVNANYGAWVGGADVLGNSQIPTKLEKLLTS